MSIGITEFGTYTSSPTFWEEQRYFEMISDESKRDSMPRPILPDERLEHLVNLHLQIRHEKVVDLMSSLGPNPILAETVGDVKRRIEEGKENYWGKL